MISRRHARFPWAPGTVYLAFAWGAALTMSTRLLAVTLSTVALAAGCTESAQDRLHDDWQQTMRCSAYYTLRAESAQRSRTAAGRRTADTAQADAALTFEYSHELGRLAGKTLADTDAALREITADLRDTVDADLSNIGRLRTRYEDQCATIVTGSQARIELWQHELAD